VMGIFPSFMTGSGLQELLMHAKVTINKRLGRGRCIVRRRVGPTGCETGR
jgi:hypothetical protein